MYGERILSYPRFASKYKTLYRSIKIVPSNKVIVVSILTIRNDIYVNEST